MELRIARASDAKGMLEIYAPYVKHTAISFESEVPTLAQFEKRIENGLQKYPWIVCLDGNTLAGYVYASGHREREAYQWTAECSVYIHENYKGKGLGRELYLLLFNLLRLQGIRNLYAGITLPNEASVRLHEKCGFEHFALYYNVGFKLGQWQKVGWWRLGLNDYDPDPPPPIKFPELEPSSYAHFFKEA